MSILTSPPTVTFNGNDLNQVPGLLIQTRDIFNDGQRMLNSQKLARTDKSVLTTGEYVSKMITIAVAIVQDTRTLLEAASDQLNSLIQDIEGTLSVTQNGVTRNYTATLHSSTVDYTTGGLMQKTFVFLCSDPFGYDAAPVNLFSLQTMSSTTGTVQFSVDGSYKIAPIVTLTVSAVTGGTGGQITITNSQTGLGITISRDFINGDIIEINGDTGITQVNGVNTNVSGKIPYFSPGLRTLQYVDNFATRTVTVGATYTKKWL